MRKSILIMLTLIPVIAGYILNLTLMVPGIGMLLFYLIPAVIMVFWFYLGKLYSKTSWRIVPALLIGNAVGLLSLLLYIWEFLLHSDDTRNLFLAGLSQYFTASGPTFLTARIAILFEPQKNVIGRASVTGMQVIGVVFIIFIFAAGYIWGVVNRRKQDHKTTKK